MAGQQVGIGKFGNIKKMMKMLSKRDAHIDLEFLCGPHGTVLMSHRFIVSAQSKFLKTLMEDLPYEDKYQIALPDIQPQHMEIVLQFLYTGKMKLGYESVEPVRELLVKILRIDADFKLPCDPSLLKQNDRNNEDDENGQNGQNESSKPTNSQNRGEQPPAKRFRSSNGSQGQHRPNCNGPQDAPMSPPHELSNDFSDDEDVRVITPPPKTPPPLVDLSDNEDTRGNQIHTIESERMQQKDPVSDHVIAECNLNELESKTPEPEQNEQDPTLEDQLVAEEAENDNPFEGLHLMAAPKIIAKKTAAMPPKKRYFAVKSTPQVPKAPGFIAKSTGKRKRKRKKSPYSNADNISSHNHSVETPTDQKDSNEKEDEFEQIVQQESVVVPVENGADFVFRMHSKADDEEPLKNCHQRTTRRSAGAKRKTYVETLSEDDLDFREEDDDIKDPTFDHMLDPARASTPSPPSSPEFIDLPPPVPEAPEPGCVIYRGEWTKVEKVARIKSRSKNSSTTSKVKKYHPNLFNITARTLKDTEKYRQAPKGHFKCPHCSDVFEVKRSLEVHIGRRHNAKSNIPCPENCGKYLTCKSAIAKHLLSHRPREQWPYKCEFCGMQFQAKSDLPKHWNTSKHLGDPRIPLPNTPEYTEVLTRSEILHNLKKMKKEAEDSISNQSSTFLSPPASTSSSSRLSATESANSPDNLVNPPIISDNDAANAASAVTVNVIPPLVPSMFTVDSPARLQNEENEDEIPDLDL